jgi:hypothetical protein
VGFLFSLFPLAITAFTFLKYNILCHLVIL